MVTAQHPHPAAVPTDPVAPVAPVAPADPETLRELAGSVPDPELPMITLAELGVVRRVTAPEPGRVDVELTPTYTGCPAIETMAADIETVLRERGGAREVTVRTVLTPPWSTDDITEAGRRKLAEHGIAPPRPLNHGTTSTGSSSSDSSTQPGPVPLSLGPTRHRTPEPADPVRCPHCGSADTTVLSRFSSTACKSLRRCEFCREPFDHFKEL